MKRIFAVAVPFAPVALGLAQLTGLVEGCGSSSVTLPIGIEDDGGATFAAPGDATAPPASLTVSITPDEPTICAGQCVDLAPNASGGTAPYAYQWDHGVTGGTAHVCPRTTTTYGVTATDDSRRAGELASTARTGTARATVTVSGACADGGPPEAEAGAGPAESCDSVVSQFSTTGANPSGPWLFGETPGLAGPFTPFDRFYRIDWAGDGGDTFPFWELGIINTPSIGFNDQASIVTYVSCPLSPNHFAMCTDPIFGKLPVARWTAAAAGMFHATATFEGTCSGAEGVTVADVHILHNSVAATSGFLNSQGAGNTTTLDLDLGVAAGDTIDFTFVGTNSGTNLDWTATVDARVCKRGGADGG